MSKLIKAAGVDMKAVIRAGMVTTLEGAMLYGVFHGDLHAGNLLVDDEGHVALLDHGITGRLDQQRRLAFIRMLMGAVTNDIQAQLAAFRDLGALPMDTDLDRRHRQGSRRRPAREGPDPDGRRTSSSKRSANIVKKL